MEDITGMIAGTWRLVHSISIDADGKKEYPFGEDAVGYIHYSDSGIMAVQISRKSRAEAKDLPQLKHEYLAYFGRYEVDKEKWVVRHFVEGQLFPGEHSGVLERKYRFDGDLMSLKPVDGTNREIVWRRVREESAAKAA
jgi:catechol 1,2-dioxygenase